MRTRSLSTGTASTSQCREMREKVGGCEPARPHAEDHDVGLHVRRIECDAGDARKPLRQHLRVVVILLQSGRTVLERDEPGGGEDAGLAHASAEHLSNRPATLDELTAADNHRPHGSAEPFAETELHGVELPRHVCDVLLQIRRSIEDPCAVEVHMNAGTVRAIADVVATLVG